jgi:hypothetical protein
MANPTTNFGWVMPTSTDLVTDLPADFAIFGQAVDTSMAELKGGTTGQVLSKTSNTDMDFTWVAQDDSNAIQNAIVDAKGDLITATAADTPARLAVGTNGQTLVADSSTATGLKWASASGGGKVLQVVQGTTSTAVANSTSTFADTNLTASITPTLSTSKVLIMVMQNGIGRSSGNDGQAWVGKLLRGATDLTTFAGFEMYTGTFLEFYSSASAVYLDSPATTSATTYKTQFKALANAASVSCQNGGASTSTITLLEIGA